jgi:hypothetical protein
MIKFTKALLMASLILMSVAFVNAQITTGSVSGSITDPKGAVVPGATVTIKNTESGVERTATTNESGAFTIPQVNPGTYAVTIVASGFKKVSVPDAKVSVAQDTTLTLQLEVGGVGETVTVTSAQDVVNTTSPSITNVINTRQVVDLPLGDRNPVTLAGLQAGIAVNGTDVRGATPSGLRQTAVNLTQDGINAMDNFVKTSSFFALNSPSLNATDEFSVTTSNAGAEAGRGAVQVNMVTKAGTNEFHGGGFLQIINEAYNANTYFNNFTHIAKPVLRQHYYGFDIGGPAYFLNFGEGKNHWWSGKNKAFFFFSYEAFRQNRAGTINQTVLTQNARNGVFQYNCSALPSPPNPAGTFDPNCPAGTTKTINLLAIGTAGSTLNPLMTAHLAQIPLPNNNSCAASDGFNIGCFNFNALEATTNDKYVLRYDHQLFNNTRLGSHKLELVWSRVITGTHPDVFTNGLEAPFPGGVDGFQASTRNLLTPALVSSFGTHITNTLRYGRQWAPVIFDRNSFPTAPFISLPGVLTNFDNTFLAQPRNTIVNQITDTLADVKGNHLLKFGGDFQNVLGISRNDAGIVETIQLSGTSTANPTGITAGNLPGSTSANVTAANTTYATIVGLLGSASQTFNVTSPTSGFVPGATRLRTVQEKDLALFGQDQWRVRSNMTVTAGLRWDYMGVPTVPNGLAIQPDFKDMYGISGFGNLFKPTAAAGSQTVGVATQHFVSGKTGIGLYKNDWNNFAPSVGLAWQPIFKSGLLRTLFGKEGESSIRAGYSISYLHDGVTTFTNLLGTGTTNPGLIQTATKSTLFNPPTNQLTGQLTSAGVPILVPTFTLPITDRQNFLVSSNNGLWTADPNLRVPYVHEWNIGFEREIMKDTALEVRYVGNYEPNGWRTENINEVNIFENGFLTDFLGAQKNLALYQTAFPSCSVNAPGNGFPCRFGNAGLAGQVNLPLLSALFTGFSATSGSGFANGTFITNLNNNQVGTFANTLAFSSTYAPNRESTTIGLPGNLFVANPNAAFVNILQNTSKSWYNAMEVELRKRFSHGLQFQADYTWSKAMLVGDAQGNNQADTANPVTFRNLSIDHRRSSGDQTQRFVANAVYDLPVGKGKAFLGGADGIVDKIIGHWTLGAITTWSTGVPFYITSGRTTFNSSTAGQGAQLTGISFADFKKNVGLFKVPGGTLFINPNILDLTFCTAAQVGKSCNAVGAITSSKLKAGLMSAPAPGTFGNFPYLSLNGPSYFDLDMSLTKRIPITERVRFEFKVTALNVLNRAAFTGPGSQTFDSTSFGIINSQKNNARSMNFIGQLRF